MACIREPLAGSRRASTGSRRPSRSTNLDGSDATIDARGMLALISSGIRTGDRIRISADGTDEVAALAAVGDLIQSGVCHPDVGP